MGGVLISSFSLQRYFTTIALISTVVAAVLISWFYVTQERQAMLDIGERHNTLLVKSIGRSIVEQFRGHLVIAAGLASSEIRALPAHEMLDRAVKLEVSKNELPVLKVKIFSLDSKAVYSTSHDDIGIIRDSHNLEWEARKYNRTVSKLEFRKQFLAISGKLDDRYVLSTYVPILDAGNPDNSFIVEFYTDVTEDVAAINATQLSMLLGSAGVLFLVFIVMFLAARKADSIIDLEAELSREAMEDSNRLGKILDQSANEIFVFTTDTLEFIQVNRGACHNLGYSEQELRSMTPVDIKPEYTEQQFREAIRPLIEKQKKQLLFETVHRRKDGSLYPVEVRLQISSASDRPMFVAVIMDISDRKAAEDRISFLAYHDELTELPNRNLFLDRLQQSIYDADREEELVAVMFLDLDRFKTINDSLGHTAGDELLILAARRLGAVLRAGDTIARLGGDEFAIVLAGIRNVSDCTRVAEKMLDCMAQPFSIGGKELVVTASIGITLFPFDNAEVHGLLKNADIAMYHAKEAGRNNYQFYSSSMAEAAAERLGVELNLRQALISDQFELHYQPILDSQLGTIVGVESLIRWRHPDGGLVGPDKFISIAEETGLIVPIGEWVLRTACEQIGALEDLGLKLPRVAVNLSPRQILEPGLVDSLRAIFDQTGFAPEKLDLEITEGLLMENTESINELLHQITDMGISLSIDDFGTGYSSLSYLRKLPITNLKIDRSFVRELPENRGDAAIVDSIISMAHFLGMKTIAEGVETEAQLDQLTRAGCDIVQGYLISKPLPLEQLCQFIKDGQSRQKTENGRANRSA